MAIFHATTKPISRSSGRSATASAAYRAGCKIDDDRTGLKHDYSKKSGVLIAVAFDKNNMQIDRSELWNLAEKVEKRKDARTAREWILAIPHELIPDHKPFLNDINDNPGAWVAFKFAQELAKRYNVGVDVAIHAPDNQGDNRNYHAHIMTTTRELKNENGLMLLGEKSTIELSNTKRKEKELGSTISEIKELRELWADIVNNALELYGSYERIDHRSHKDREIDCQPTKKIGWRASAMERRGIKTDRGNINRKIINKNKEIVDLESLIAGEKIYQKAMEQHETIKQARLAKELRNIAKRTPFDLLKIILISEIVAPEKEQQRDDLSGELSIGQSLYDAIQLRKKGYSLKVFDRNNKHLEHNETAQNIKKFILKNLNSFEIVKDYGELSIDKFTDKYAIDCDLSDLVTIHELNPPLTPSTAQKRSDEQVELTVHPKNVSHDFRI